MEHKFDLTPGIIEELVKSLGSPGGRYLQDYLKWRIECLSNRLIMEEMDEKNFKKFLTLKSEIYIYKMLLNTFDSWRNRYHEEVKR